MMGVGYIFRPSEKIINFKLTGNLPDTIRLVGPPPVHSFSKNWADA